MVQNASRSGSDDDELDDDDRFEDEDSDDDGGGDDELSGEGNDQEDEPDPAVVAYLERRETELLEALEKGDTTHPIYPKWQRVLSRKDSRITEQDKLLEQAIQRIEELEDQVGGAKAGFDWVSNELIENLPETRREKAQLGLREAALKHREAAGKRRAEKPKPAPAGDDELPEWFVEQQAKFIDGRKAAAKRAGVDPESKDLDFGKPTDPIVVRLDTFEESLQRLIESKDESRIDAVRRKGPGVSTRNGGGTKSATRMGPLNDSTTLQRGAAARLKDILDGKYGK